MESSPNPPSAVAPRTLGEFFVLVLRWLKSNFLQAALSAVIGFVVSATFNLLMMALWYDGYNVPYGGAAAGKGNLLAGGLLWGLFSTLVFGLWGYRRAVGSERFWRDVRNFPQTLRQLVQGDGHGARVHLLWGASVGLAASPLIGACGGAVVAASLATAANTLPGRLLTNVLYRLWLAIVGAFAPTRQHTLSGPLSMTVGILGSSAALMLAFVMTIMWTRMGLGLFFSDSVAKVVLAVVCAAAAISFSGTTPPKIPAAVNQILLLAGPLALVLFATGEAWADDHGYWEDGGLIPWITGGGLAGLLPFAMPGATVAAFGSAFGAAIGGALGGTGPGLGLDSSTESSGEVQQQPASDASTTEPADGEGAEGASQSSTAAGRVPYTKDHYSRLSQMLTEVTDPQLYARAEALSKQAESGSIDSEELANIERAQQGIADRRSAEIDAQQEKDAQAWQQRVDQDRAAAEAEMAEFNRRRAAEEAEAAQARQMEDYLRQRIEKMASDPNTDPAVAEAARQAIATGDPQEMRDFYRPQVAARIKQSSAEAAAENTKAALYGAGETVSKITLAAARGGLMAIGGPAGMLPTALAMGMIGAAEEGAQSQATGESVDKILKKTAIGFLSGAKNGAAGVYTNTPGMSMLKKMLVQGGGDTVETFLRTGDVKQALAMGTISAVSEKLGGTIDAITPGLKREAAAATMSSVSAGVANVVQGGTFGEGFQNGMFNHFAAKGGGSAAKGASAYTKTIPKPDEAPHRSEPADPAKLEQRVNDAVQAASQSKKGIIDIKDQHPLIQNLENSRYKSVVPDPITRKPLTDANGDLVTKDYVNARKALEQLAETRSSRTAKQADPEIRNAIINTRQDKIYGPADAATIATTTKRLEEAGILQPGDRLKIDTFSTPGKPPSLGADRDARMVIERIGSTGRPELIEVPRKHWEKDAYVDFANHTKALATEAGGQITKDTHPDYFRRKEELQHLKGDGWTDAQIDARAWGEAHNQLFTDKTHMEASRDNSDQTVRVTGRTVEPAQKTSSVLEAKEGRGTLGDPEGAARMWKEKSEFYAHGNMPEALAQSQKGIEGFMELRKGYRQQGLEPPPLSHANAKAMEIITGAPVGVDVTPDRIAQVERDLQAIGFRDTRDAMQRIALQNEGLKWSKPIEATQGATTPTTDVASSASPSSKSTEPILGASTVAAIARPSAPISRFDEKKDLESQE